MSRTGGNLVVFDLETGGFKADKNPLVEVCFICYDTITLQEVSRYESLVKPYYEHPKTKVTLVYEQGALNAHGIPIRQMEEDGKDLIQVMRESFAFLKSCKTPGRFGKPTIAGHNIVDFDIPFFTTIADWFNLKWMDEVQKVPFDTLPMARLIWPQTQKDIPSAKVENHQLGTCCSAVGVKLVDAHRAAADTEANAEWILKWFQMMRGGTVAIGVEDKIDNKAIPYQF